MDGFLNFNKPYGWTSHDCVAFVRRQARLKRVGHAGTLDPAATGVLPMALGRATRLLQYLQSDKTYRATIRFGVRTATDDLDGEVIESHDASGLDFETVQSLLPKFKGTIQQVPPQYSAIQVGGKRLYDLARSGIEVDVPVRTVEVYRLEVLDWRSPPKTSSGSPSESPELEIAIACSSGTYIRAIARDLGELAGVGATLSGLCRTESSGFALAESLTAEQVEQAVATETLPLIEPAIALQHLPTIHLDAEISRRWRMGQRIALDPQTYKSWIDANHAKAVLEQAGSTDMATSEQDLSEQYLSEQRLSEQYPSEQYLSVFDEGDRFLGVSQVEWLSSPVQPASQLQPAEQAAEQPAEQERSDMNDMGNQANGVESASSLYLLRPKMVFCPT
ncbi:MAG: tRNA pseudouridine(55) synthase TruB [Elainellaceae cyanobacterium]